MIDLFEHYDQQPKELQAITDKYSELIEEHGDSYKLCKAMLKECEAIGYTFDYGLDAVAYDLRPLPDL